MEPNELGFPIELPDKKPTRSGDPDSHKDHMLVSPVLFLEMAWQSLLM